VRGHEPLRPLRLGIAVALSERDQRRGGGANARRARPGERTDVVDGNDAGGVERGGVVGVEVDLSSSDEKELDPVGDRLCP
jgi:hypothetical protein